MCPQILTNTYQELNNKCQMYLLDYYRLNFVMVELLSNIWNFSCKLNSIAFQYRTNI